MPVKVNDLGTEIQFRNSGTDSVAIAQYIDGDNTVRGQVLAGGYFYAATGATASDPSLGFYGDSNTGFFRQAADKIGVAANGTEVLRFVAGVGSGETCMMLMRNIGGTLTLVNVSVDAVDSGGTGYRTLRVPNSAAA